MEIELKGFTCINNHITKVCQFDFKTFVVARIDDGKWVIRALSFIYCRGKKEFVYVPVLCPMDRYPGSTKFELEEALDMAEMLKIKESKKV